MADGNKCPLAAWWDHAVAKGHVSVDNVVYNQEKKELMFVNDVTLSRTPFEIKDTPGSPPTYLDGVAYADVVREWVRIRYLQKKKNERRNNKRRKIEVASPSARVTLALVRHYIRITEMPDWGETSWNIAEIGKINDFYITVVKRLMATARANSYINTFLIGGNCYSTQNRCPTFLVVLLATVYKVSRPFCLLVLQWCCHNSYGDTVGLSFSYWWRTYRELPNQRAIFCSNIWCRALVMWDNINSYTCNTTKYPTKINNMSINELEVVIPEFRDGRVNKLWGGESVMNTLWEISTTKAITVLKYYTMIKPNNALWLKLAGLFALRGGIRSVKIRTKSMREHDQKKAEMRQSKKKEEI